MNKENSVLRHQWGHNNRPDLTGEHKFGDAGQLILLIIFLATWILDSFVFKYSSFLRDHINWIVTIIPAAIIFTSGGYFTWNGLRKVFGEVRTTPQVITGGVFSIVRHPVYLGTILAVLGLVILTLSIISFVIWIIFVAFYCYISSYEEKLLLARFGQEYEEYRKKVPMLFPIRFRSIK